MSFDVGVPGIANGILGGGMDRDKYYAISDENGNFELSDLGDDVRSILYPNFVRSYVCDSTQITWKYFTQGSHDDSLWIVKGENTALRLKLAGLTYFHHPIKNNAGYAIDSILIQVYGQNDMITKKKQKSKVFYLLPSKLHNIELTYVSQGQRRSRTIQKYISCAYSTLTDESYAIMFNDFDVYLPE